MKKPGRTAWDELIAERDALLKQLSAMTVLAEDDKRFITEQARQNSALRAERDDARKELKKAEAQLAAQRAQILEAMRLFRTDDGYTEAMRLLRVLTGGPAETAFEKIVREAPSVPITDLFRKP